MSSIPDRWLSYSSMGEPIAGTRFICFKVPLKHTLCADLQDSDRFTPEMLMEQCPKLGLVVDLTNTNRYYNGQIFESKGIQYKKINCPGQVVPADSILRQFFSTVDAFLNESSERDSLVGVHCTHGLNRTGYFICRYLNLRMGFRPQEAISAFEKARGYRIERGPYVRDIMSGRSIEGQLITQHRHTSFRRDDRRHQPRYPSLLTNGKRDCNVGHLPGLSEPPPLPQMRHTNVVFESPLANLYSNDVTNSSSTRYGPSKSDRAFKRRERRTRWDSPIERNVNDIHHTIDRLLVPTPESEWLEGPRHRDQFHNSSTHRNGENQNS